MVYDTDGRSEGVDAAELAVVGALDAREDRPWASLVTSEMVETIYRRCRKFAPAGSDEIEKLRIRRVLEEASEFISRRTMMEQDKV